ncbi:MAG: c-type cytochrome [Acidobacteriia bacterium]|nr:c-type cytochrome [Terriglobia bacterium]
MRSSVPGAFLGIAAWMLMTACSGTSARTRQGFILTGGDARRGPAAIFKYGCGSCHTIQGISNAHGLVGPPLTGIGDRLYIGGVLRNTPGNMVRWIQDPKAVDDKTAMPRLGVTSPDATDIAAYLYSTKEE